MSSQQMRPVQHERVGEHDVDLCQPPRVDGRGRLQIGLGGAKPLDMVVGGLQPFPGGLGEHGQQAVSVRT
jgi:hypothetical protein